MSEHMSDDKGIAIPLDWHVPEDLIPRYATNFVVQGTGHEFVISFFEAMPPVILGTIEEQKEQAKSVGSVQARCVARIVVSPSRMLEFAQLLLTHLNAQTLQLNAQDSDEE